MNDLEPADIKPADYTSAYRLLIATRPGHTDQVAINAAIEDIDPARYSELLMALCTLAHIAGPQLRTATGVTALQALIAQSTHTTERTK